MRFTLLCVVSVFCAAADWPRFGGPTGDFQVSASDSPLRWPEGGPKRLWERPLGEGYSQIVTDGSSLYTMYRRDDKDEVVISLDARTGKTLWEFAYEAPLPSDFDRSNTTGPRATPLIVGDKLFTAGAGGKLHCLGLKTGKPLWTRDIVKDFHGQIRINGYAASPLAWRDTIIVFPSAKDGAVMALRQSDGSVVWKKHSYTVSYASPTVIKFGGREQLIAQFSNEVTALNLDSGELEWSFPHANDQLVNVSTPVFSNDGFLFLSSAYSGAGHLLHLISDGTSTKVEEVWTQRLIRVHHSNAVRIGDIIYAAAGDLGPCPLAAVDFKTGRVYWRDRAFPKASLVAVGNQLLILDEDGTLTLATPGEKGLEVHGKMSALKSNAWTAPTLVGKYLYLRDRQNVTALSFE